LELENTLLASRRNEKRNFSKLEISNKII